MLPEVITPEDLSRILGIGKESARNIFKQKDFPKIPNDVIGNIGKADKEMARLYIQGTKIKNNSNDNTFNLILLELRKLNSKLEVITNTYNRKDVIDDTNNKKIENIIN